jgi:hypothetical protein
MRVIPPSLLTPAHPDFAILDPIRQEIAARAGGLDRLKEMYPGLVRDAIDFLLDPVRTARREVSELDNVEKTFIGLKLEHVVRDLLDVPKGVRDLVINGMDVDIKNTIANTWTIPPETYENSEPCLLMAADDVRCLCWLGLIVARPEYLGSDNRDRKRSVVDAGFQHILWIVVDHSFPPSRFAALDMTRFRELRKVKGGSTRTEMFFEENLRKPIHRTVVFALLHDQDDPMKRVRGNSGARDKLRPKRIALLSGRGDAALIQALKLPATSPSEFIAIKPITPEEDKLIDVAGKWSGKGDKDEEE